ncbi:MAG: hypothetical protein ACYDBX_00485 [Patescibacteria group bacterium]
METLELGKMISMDDVEDSLLNAGERLDSTIFGSNCGNGNKCQCNNCKCGQCSQCRISQ